MSMHLPTTAVSRRLLRKQVRRRSTGRLFPRGDQKLSGNIRISYGVVSGALLLTWFLRWKLKSSNFYVSDVLQGSGKEVPNAFFKDNKSEGNLRETKSSSGISELSSQEGEERQNSKALKSSGPPSYLPLAQHLKHMNYSRREISLRDMVFGTEKHEIQWIVPLNAGIRKFKPNFQTYCAVPSDKIVVDVLKRYDRRLLSGLRFVVYQPLNHGKLPAVDLMFSRRGLEQYDLEAIQEVFKDALKQEIKYVLLGNSPRYENAKVVETGPGTFSIKRPDFLALNVRAYPFGFNAATRVFSVVGKQLLFYKTQDMRDGW